MRDDGAASEKIERDIKEAHAAIALAQRGLVSARKKLARALAAQSRAKEKQRAREHRAFTLRRNRSEHEWWLRQLEKRQNLKLDTRLRVTAWLLRQCGLSFREIGRLLGKSEQRANVYRHQINREIQHADRSERERPTMRATQRLIEVGALSEAMPPLDLDGPLPP